MDTEEWEDLVEAHGWYNGASPPETPEKQKRTRASIDATADK